MSHSEDSEFSRGFLAGSLTVTDDTPPASARGYAEGPERALLSALLFDGIHACITYILTKTSRQRSQNAEAYYWVMGRESEYPFSFENVCEALGMNPQYLRLGLLRASPAKLAQVARCRRLS